jgi:hypothetical protein
MRGALRLGLLGLGLFCCACGYQPVYAAHGDPLHVKLVRSEIADPVAADEVAAGLREELARAGALAPGEAYPRVEIEVLKAEEASEGVVAASVAAPVATSRAPLARATTVAVVARAWVVASKGGEPQASTGDMRAEDTLAVDEGVSAPDPRSSAFHYADALRASARRLGHALGARVLGLPAGSDETGE